MPSVDFKSLLLGVVVVCMILASLSYAFYKYMILHDYKVITDPNEAPELNIANPDTSI